MEIHEAEARLELLKVVRIRMQEVCNEVGRFAGSHTEFNPCEFGSGPYGAEHVSNAFAYLLLAADQLGLAENKFDETTMRLKRAEVADAG